ncbi:fatty acyl-CoA hydrolase precursor, medium chain-like isoform X2 [Malaclemys terrapin pileata]|uniref:fatty acyl-CoA hydrolase precursor, medium chain-like isoform X2 n=1 Tax=Malaclemys terrapin pileata TaxID=2991368 RepID=UPI0023A8F2EF|nr:fatty acyl-CoA hydrolase precursor, medium chain-like isoform X2 [Malaclemys terrapin pileata]
MSTGENILLLSLIFAAWFTTLTVNGQNAAHPEVVTKYGKLRGQQIKADGAETYVDIFLGIPFAKPPVGPLRFSPPEPAEPWKGLRDATSYPPMCLQDPVSGQQLSDAFTNRKEKLPFQVSEDCLFLNVYTPASSDKDMLPVMVWIHGGGLVIGAASTYDGSALSAFENVVVVTIQYRLGVLGYFSSGDEHARGNWGYLDQVAALQWIQENIEHFGGDPGSVTIFGESAGGISVSALVLSPLANGLFHKAISESGVTIKMLFTAHPEAQANKIARVSGCQSTSSAAMVHCLREKTEEEIIEITLKMEFTTLQLNAASSGDSEKSLFISAVLDGVFFPKSPEELLAEKAINAVPYIIGTNNHEFGWLLPNMLKYPAFTEGLDKETVTSLLLSSEFFTHVPAEFTYLLSNEYLSNIEEPIQLRDRLFELMGDAVFVVPGIQTARYCRDSGNLVYVYHFHHRPSSHEGVRPDFVKADHGDETGYVFGKPFLAGDATEEEGKLSRTIMKYWANFARKGNPNDEGLVTWPAYNVDEQYLIIDLKQKAAKKLKENRVEFWTKILPKKMAEGKREHKEL